MIKLMVAILLMVWLLDGCDAKSAKIIGIDNLDPAEEANLKRLAPYYLRISKELVDIVEDDIDVKMYPEDIVNLAKVEINTKPGCFSICSIVHKDKQKAKEDALALFVSLEKSLDDCDWKSYEILARNSVVSDQLSQEFWAYVTRDVLMNYMMKHAEICRPVHKQRFAEHISNVPAHVQAKLERAFKSIDIGHFGLSQHSHRSLINLVSMAKPVLTDPSSQKAVELIGSNLSSAKSGQTKAGADELKPLLDRELFEPCKVFREELATVLDLARIDAKAFTAHDRVDLDKLYWKDEQFYLAMVSNRLCAALLAEQEKLYEPLIEAYNKVHE